MGLKIFAGSRSRMLCESISREFDIPVLNVQKKIFSDGEQYVRLLDPVAGEKVVVVQSLYPNPEPALFELLLAVDALKRAGAELRLVVPYLAYSRQDKKFLDGEPVSADVVLAAIASTGMSELVTFDCHFARNAAVDTRAGVTIRNVSAFDLLVSEVTRDMESPILVAPDKTMEGPLSKFGDVVTIDKHRDRITGDVSSDVKEYDAGGRTVVFVDDIIASGGTMVNAARFFVKPEKLVACCTHGLFTGNAAEKFSSAGFNRIISTDTIESQHSKVSVALLLEDVLK